MSKEADWDKVKIQTLIVAKVNLLRDKANFLLVRGQEDKAVNHIWAMAEWEDLLKRFKGAEIRWPESGGEGS